MGKEWAIDWDLLFQNFAAYAHWDAGSSPTLHGLLFGSPGRIHVPIFAAAPDNYSIRQIGSCLSSDVDLVGVIRVDGASGDHAPTLPKGGVEIKMTREHLEDKNIQAIKKANPFLIDAKDEGLPKLAVTKVNFECILRFNEEKKELITAFDRQIMLLDSIAFLTPDRKILSAAANEKDKLSLPIPESGPVRLMAMQATAPPPSEEETIVPVVRVAKGVVEVTQLRVPIDVAVVIDGVDTIRGLQTRLVEAIRRRLEASYREMIKLLPKKASLALSSGLFFPPGWSRPLNLQRPANYESEGDALEWRRDMHKLFNLPAGFPVIRSGQNILASTPGLIRDIHKHVKNYRPLDGGEIAVVKSGYDYYHYLQQGFDDSGWGCAYRSGQSIASWFLINGFVEGVVPTHREIQECLVKIGDKMENFIGSRKWIGSTELGFVLETLFGISYKIMTTNSGIEVADRARELLYHFRRVGTPVMIGGGQLAHTILGVDMNVDTGEVRFLVLDPHYTGRDELGAALAGGCKWEKASFWRADSFYNLLLPQIPINVI